MAFHGDAGPGDPFNDLCEGRTDRGHLYEPRVTLIRRSPPQDDPGVVAGKKVLTHAASDRLGERKTGDRLGVVR